MALRPCRIFLASNDLFVTRTVLPGKSYQNTASKRNTKRNLAKYVHCSLIKRYYTRVFLVRPQARLVGLHFSRRQQKRFNKRSYNFILNGCYNKNKRSRPLINERLQRCTAVFFLIAVTHSTIRVYKFFIKQKAPGTEKGVPLTERITGRDVFYFISNFVIRTYLCSNANITRPSSRWERDSFRRKFPRCRPFLTFDFPVFIVFLETMVRGDTPRSFA